MSASLADPKNLNIYMKSNSFEQTPELISLTDPWFKTKYGVEQFSQKFLSLMQAPNVGSLKSQRKVLDLPPANNLLPKSVDILPPIEDASQKPILLKQWADDTDLWYKKDDKFNRPKGIVSLKIYTGDCEFGRTP